MRLLLVEDDVMIGAGIRMGLRQEDFVVDWVQDGRAAELALAARIRAVLRRQAGRAEPRVTFGRLTLDPAARRVTQAGREIPVSAREFALLEALLHRPGAALSRAQLEERIYGWGEEVASNSVEVHIHNLRKKLGDATIRTVRGVGYAIANDSDAPCRSAENSS